MKSYMETSQDAAHNQKKPLSPSSASILDNKLRAIAYSMDTLIPGFYAWFGLLKIRIGGSEAEETYPGTIHSFADVALVLPGYQIFSTYQGDYDL